ncbi:MAG TPA: hypothetical protein VFQ76_10115 [Longimicrobiaceae bacterium]|nr:hypothetical protein [Longimicrobiaceae bacterium]
MNTAKRTRRIVLVTAAAALTMAIGTLKAQEESSGPGEEAGLLKTYEYKGPDRYICWLVDCSGTQCCYVNQAT